MLSYGETDGLNQIRLAAKASLSSLLKFYSIVHLHLWRVLLTFQ